jgi:hypothetical protein
MEQARELRENAIRFLRLSKSVNSPNDVALLETLAAQATEKAERIEAEEAASAAERSPVDRSAAGGASGADFAVSERPEVLTNRDAELELDTLSERRRPGRRVDVSPVLISLMREDSLGGLSDEPTDDEPAQLRPPRGIVIWSVISAAMLALLSWWVL